MVWEPCGMACVYAAVYYFAMLAFLAGFISSVVGTGDIVCRNFIDRGYRCQIVTGASQYLVVVAASALQGVFLFFR